MSGQFCTLAVFYAMEVFFTFNIIWYYAVEEKRKDAFYRSSSDVVVITIKAWSVTLWLGNQLSITYSYDELNSVVWLLLCPVFEMELLFKYKSRKYLSIVVLDLSKYMSASFVRQSQYWILPRWWRWQRWRWRIRNKKECLSSVYWKYF